MDHAHARPTLVVGLFKVSRTHGKDDCADRKPHYGMKGKWDDEEENDMTNRGRVRERV